MTDNTKNNLNNLQKIAWACRRGMLELDLLLNPFLEKKYNQLNIQEKEIFHEFLDYSDPELFAWLLGHESPDDERLKPIIDKIREHARTKLST